jgi:hypothetical protein
MMCVSCCWKSNSYHSLLSLNMKQIQNLKCIHGSNLQVLLGLCQRYVTEISSEKWGKNMKGIYINILGSVLSLPAINIKYLKICFISWNLRNENFIMFHLPLKALHYDCKGVHLCHQLCIIQSCFLYCLCNILCYWCKGSVVLLRIQTAVVPKLMPDSIRTWFWHFTPCHWNDAIWPPVFSQHEVADGGRRFVTADLYSKSQYRKPSAGLERVESSKSNHGYTAATGCLIIWDLRFWFLQLWRVLLPRK